MRESDKNREKRTMWYFTWLIGVTMAVLLSVMHALWLEVQVDEAIIREKGAGKDENPSR
ncbi:MAG: cytochrome bd-I oxidase subunit CydX [Leptospirales bacterium]